MLKKITVLTLLAFLITEALTFNSAFTNSAKPPLGKTGAPSETKACNDSHGGAPNTGSGKIEISFNGATSYSATKTSKLTVTVTDATKAKFGFEILAFDKSNKSVGTFVANSAEKVGVAKAGSGKQYAFHNPAKTTNSYSFDWVAPETVGTGDITFYAAGIAANNNGANSGDLVYTTKATLTELIDGIDLNPAHNAVTMFSANFNPLTKNLTANIGTNSMVNSHLAVYNLQGQPVSILLDNKILAPGEHQYNADLSALPSGFYLVVLNNEGKTTAQRIVIH